MSGLIQFWKNRVHGPVVPVSSDDPLPVSVMGSVDQALPRANYGTQKTTINNSTAETTIVTAGGAGVFNDVYSLILANTGAVTTEVDIRRSTGGAVIVTFEVPAADTRGFMLPWTSAKKQLVAANNWTATCTAGTTSMEVSVDYIKVTS
jgi:hypothetical protein